jgi:hypothetical protein
MWARNMSRRLFEKVNVFGRIICVHTGMNVPWKVTALHIVSLCSRRMGDLCFVSVQVSCEDNCSIFVRVNVLERRWV